MMSINLNNIASSTINGDDYRYIIIGISKSGAVNVLWNADLTKKKEYYKDNRL